MDQQINTDLRSIPFEWSLSICANIASDLVVATGDALLVLLVLRFLRAADHLRTLLKAAQPHYENEHHPPFLYSNI